jgi:hypothetical protein
MIWRIFTIFAKNREYETEEYHNIGRGVSVARPDTKDMD